MHDGRLELGGVTLELTGVTLELGGITGWTLRGIDPDLRDLDGLPTRPADLAPAPAPAGPAEHPNGARALDHVVITTPDFERTGEALERAGLPLRRVRDAGGFRQGFRRLGPAIMEIVEAPPGAGDPSGPARFWGLVVIVGDLERLRARLGAELIGEPRPAVQAGRHIATLARAAGLTPRVAFMDPEPPA